MNDHRWSDVVRALDSMRIHLTEATRLFDEGRLEGRHREAYHRQMILMHTMEIGYTSFETALVRVMDVLNEVPPSGSDWHAQLIARSAEPMSGLRPAILSSELAIAARKVKDFRHWATRGYDTAFGEAEARGAVAAARTLLGGAADAIIAFAREVDG